MVERNILKGESILVPVSLNGDCDHSQLVSWVVEFARLLHKPVRLLHVLRSWVNVPMQLSYGEGSILFSLNESIQSSIRAQAEADLAELQSLFPRDISVSTRVYEGQVDDTILHEAAENSTCLILMVLAKSQKPRLWLEGLLTPFSILAKAEVPVLITHSQAALPDLEQPIRLLLLDDLRIHTESAVRQAFELTNWMPQAELHHVHICDLDENQIRAALDIKAENLVAGLDPQICVDDVLQAACRRLEDKLTERNKPYIPSQALPGKRWVQKVLLGTVGQQVPNYLRFAKPDMVIVGRHHAIQQRPFSLGQLSYSILLEWDMPLFMIPPVE